MVGKKNISVAAEIAENFDVARMGYIAKTRKMVSKEAFLAVIVKSFENRA
jgi:hypothetical protein